MTARERTARAQATAERDLDVDTDSAWPETQAVTAATACIDDRLAELDQGHCYSCHGTGTAGGASGSGRFPCRACNGTGSPPADATREPVPLRDVLPQVERHVVTESASGDYVLDSLTCEWCGIGDAATCECDA